MLEIQKYVRNAGPAQTRVLALPISLHEKQYGCIKHHLHNKGIFLFLLSLSLSIYFFIFLFLFQTKLWGNFDVEHICKRLTANAK